MLWLNQVRTLIKVLSIFGAYEVTVLCRCHGVYQKLKLAFPQGRPPNRILSLISLVLSHKMNVLNKLLDLSLSVKFGKTLKKAGRPLAICQKKGTLTHTEYHSLTVQVLFLQETRKEENTWNVQSMLIMFSELWGFKGMDSYLPLKLGFLQ